MVTEPFSVSRINLFDQCSLAWKRKYVEHIPDVSGKEAQVGSAAHKAIQIYTENLTNGHKRSLNSIIGEGVASVGNIDILKEVTEIIETFVVTHHNLDVETIVGIEENIEKPIDKYNFRGIIDLLQVNETTGLITDYKSSRKIISQTEIDNNLQLSSYAMLAHKKYPTLKRFICRLDFIRYGQLVETERNLEDIQLTEQFLGQKMKTISKAIDENKFDPKPNSYCKWCSYIDTCPVHPKTSTPKEVASQVLVLEALLKREKETLKAMVAKQGAVTVNDMVFDFYPASSDVFPIDKVIQVLAEYKINNPNNYLKVNTKELENLDPRIYEKLLLLSEQKTTTRFDHKRQVAQ
ncbi:MAG: PD-(D/E)XK nuclease family protein [bacterium]